jgi:hypothetical protein
MKLIYVLYDRFLSRWLAEGRKILAALVCVLVIVPIMSTSCHDNSFTTTPPAPFFPVKKEPDSSYIYPSALSEGKLVVDHSNLRLKHFWGTSDLLIWPYGYSLRIEGKELQVVDNYGQLVGRLGDKIKVGGGEVPAEIVEEYIGQPLPDDCEGPYWLVSEVIEN